MRPPWASIEAVLMAAWQRYVWGVPARWEERYAVRGVSGRSNPAGEHRGPPPHHHLAPCNSNIPQSAAISPLSWDPRLALRCTDHLLLLRVHHLPHPPPPLGPHRALHLVRHLPPTHTWFPQGCCFYWSDTSPPPHTNLVPAGRHTWSAALALPGRWR